MTHGRGDTLVNPYVVGRPLTGASASLYVGREDVFTWLSENLSVTGLPNALLLYGERRIGKTSTLYQLVEGHRGRELREDGPHRLLPVYIDLQRLAGCSTDEWLLRLARDVYRQVAQRHPSRAMPRSRPGNHSAYSAFDAALDHLEAHLPADDLVLVAIDELEQLRMGIESGLLDEAILPFLRSQVQHRPRLAVVLSGSFGLLEEYWRPLVDLTARFELRPLDYAATATLVRAPARGILEFDDAALEVIWQQTGGRPFAIQSLCHRLFSRHSRERGPIGAEAVRWAATETAAEPNGPGRVMAPTVYSAGAAS